jgi:hypothetical protein
MSTKSHNNFREVHRSLTQFIEHCPIETEIENLQNLALVSREIENGENPESHKIPSFIEILESLNSCGSKSSQRWTLEKYLHLLVALSWQNRRARIFLCVSPIPDSLDWDQTSD